MIDLHCHILPALDDGASDASETLALLKLAVADGITRMVATPHINPGYFDNTPASIQSALDLTRQLIAQAQLPIAVAAAAEVRLTDQLMPAIEQQQVPFLGQWQGQRVLLLELPHSHIPPGTDLLVKWLAKRDILAMIAHPERNRDVQANPALLNPLRRLGCLFQLTASSLLGDLGDRHQQCAEYFVAERLFNIVATDCHNLQRRPPRLAAAVARLAQLADEQYAHSLSQLMPAQISASLDFAL